MSVKPGKKHIFLNHLYVLGGSLHLVTRTPSMPSMGKTVYFPTSLP